MNRSSRLRTPIGQWGGLGVALFLSLAVIETIATGKPLLSTVGFGLFFIVLGVAEFRRTGLAVYLVLGLLWGTGTWHSLARFVTSPLSLRTYAIHVVVSVLALILCWPTLARSERLGANARRLFHLAAAQVTEMKNGYTGRPYSAGRADSTFVEARGFARHLAAKRITLADIGQDAVILTFSMGYSPLRHPPLEKISYARIDREGHLAVHISESDYRRFRQQLTFDQLCASLGEVFQRFLGYYRQGLDARIVTELGSPV